VNRQRRSIILRSLPALSAALIALSTWAITPPQAHASKSADQALQLYKKGMAAYKAGDYRGAILRYEQALTLQRHKNILYYLGESHRRIGQLREAHGYYTRYAKLEPPAKRKRLAAKLQALRFGKPSQISIATQPGGAKVLVDGKGRGTTPKNGTPLSLRIDGGKHRLRITHAGRRPVDQAITAEFAEPQALSFALPPAQAVSSSRPSKPKSKKPDVTEQLPLGVAADKAGEPGAVAMGRPAPVAAPVKATDRRSALRDDASSGRSTSLLVLGIASGALAVAGLVTAIVYTDKYNESYTTDPNLDGYGRLAVGGYIAAGMLGAGCAALMIAYALSGGDSGEKKKTAALATQPRLIVAPAIGRAGAGVTALMRF
jgi:hypothetical protein